MTDALTQLEQKAFEAKAAWAKFINSPEIQNLLATDRQAWSAALDQRRETAPGCAIHGDLEILLKAAQGRTTWMRHHFRKEYRINGKRVSREAAAAYLAAQPSEKEG